MSTALAHSALYSGWVRHRRFAPRAHAFRYRIGLLYLDLAEQQALTELSPLAGRLAAFCFRETDYLPSSRATAPAWPMRCASAWPRRSASGSTGPYVC